MTASAAQTSLGWNVPPQSESLDLRWSRFLREHPKALRDFHAIAVELLEAGEMRLSAKFLIEIARYQHIIRRSPGDPFTVNNSFSSRLARALEATYPELAGKFETRVLAEGRGGDDVGEAA